MCVRDLCVFSDLLTPEFQPEAAASPSGNRTGGYRSPSTSDSLPPTTFSRSSTALRPLASQITPADPSSRADVPSIISFGSLTNDSSVRIKMNLVSQMPTFVLNIRKNHFTGNQKQDHVRDRQRKSRHQRLPQRTIHGRDANEYNDDHLEEEYEFDLHDIAALHIDEVHHDNASFRAAARHAQASVDPKASYAVFAFRTLSNTRPTRTVGQDEIFPAHSEEAGFCSVLRRRRARTFTVLLNIDLDHQKTALRDYSMLLTEARFLTLDGNPCNGWFFARAKDYRPLDSNPFRPYVADGSKALPLMPWLAGPADEHGGKSYSSAYLDSQVGGAVRKSFCSANGFLLHFLPALLYERDHRTSTQIDLYNRTRRYRAKVRHHKGNACVIEITFGDDPSVDPGEQRLIPGPGSEVSIFIHSATQHKSGALRGRVFESSADGLEVIVPAEGAAANNIPYGVNCFASVIWRDIDVRNAKQMEAVVAACDIARKELGPTMLYVSEGLERDYFNLRNIMTDQEKDTWAPDLYSHFAPDSATEQHTADDIGNIVIDFPKRCHLDDEHMFFFVDALDGPRANVALLDGVPGSGKSTLLAVFIVTCMRLGIRCLICALSDGAAENLQDKVINLLKGDADFSDLVDRCVKYNNHTMEQESVNSLQSRLTASPTRTSADPYDIDSKTLLYIEQHPDDTDVKDYLDRMQHKGLDSDLLGRRPLSVIVKAIQRRILADSLCVSSTAFMSTDLKDLKYQASVVVFDNAAEATEADLYMTLTNQPNTMTLLISGDDRQPGPVLQSHTANANPYANLLATSPLTRFKEAFPLYTRVRLLQNYRSHPSLVSMPNDLFYDGEMVPASHTPGRWDTYLARSVKGILRAHAFRNAFPYGVETTLANDNRQFFVDIPAPPFFATDVSSRATRGGVAAVVKLAQYLVGKFKDRGENIGIISMRREDAQQLEEALADIGLSALTVMNAG